MNRALIAGLALLIAVAAGFLLLTRGRDAPPPRAVASRAFLSPAHPERPAAVWAVGDGAGGAPVARRIAMSIAADRPARLLYLGDVYENGTAKEFAEHYAPAYGALAHVTDPTPGNHEWPNHETGYDPYWARATGKPTPPWYTLRVGGWQLLSLNSEAPHGPGSEQLQWLGSVLRRSSGTCTLAFWHRPRLSAGRHGDQEDMEPVWEALRGHATLVLSGHDHDSQRLEPRGGITQLVAGAGGRGLYELDAKDPRLAFGDDRRYGALRLRLAPGSARLAFVTAGGEVLDRSAVHCQAGTR